MTRKASRAGRWFLTLVVVVFLVIFARSVDWPATWHAVRHASPSLLAAATVVNLFSALARGLRWWVFLRPIGVESMGLAVRASIAGAGLNNVLVASGGEAARVMFVSRSAQLPASTVLATLALERLFDPVCYVLLLATTATFLPLPPELARWRLPASLALIPIAIFLGMLLRASSRPSTERTAAAPDARPQSLGRRARRFGGRFIDSVAVLSTPGRFGAAMVFSAIAWMLQVATFDLTARAAGAALPLGGTIAALLAINLGLVLRATPGNVGFFQVAYALVATQFGVDKDAAVGVAFLIQSLQILPVTALAVAMAPELVFGRRSAAADAGPQT